MKCLGEVSLSESEFLEPFAKILVYVSFQFINLAEILMPFRRIYIFLTFIQFVSVLFLQEKLNSKYRFSSLLQERKPTIVQIAFI